MKQSCIKTISKIVDDIVDLEDALNNLRSAIKSDDEDQVEGALDGFPTPKNLTKTLEQLGKLIGDRPWEEKRRKRA